MSSTVPRRRRLQESHLLAGRCRNYYEYDPGNARELLAEAAADGVTLDDVNLDIPTYYTSQLAKDILTVMQANMADIGVNVNPTFLACRRGARRLQTAHWNIPGAAEIRAPFLDSPAGGADTLNFSSVSTNATSL